jgi:hypothetical protein
MTTGEAGNFRSKDVQTADLTDSIRGGRMKTMRCLLSVLLFQVYVANAKDLVAKDGVTYKDVKITETLPIGLSFISDGKAGWIDFRDLPDAVAKEYGYNPKKADEFEQQIARNQGNMVSPTDAPDMKFMPPEANLDVQTVPQTSENTTIISSGGGVTYDPSCFPSSGPVYQNRWVHWNGRYYPHYWWHHWWWRHHWVYSKGRYYPWHYYHHHGTWYHGKYYPYHHGVLKEHYCKEEKPHGAAPHQKR